MALIALRCPSCGGEIQLESVREMGFCMYCGSKVVLQEALRQQVTVDESHKVDAWITLGLEAVKSEKFDDAEQYANKVIETDVKNPTGWYIKGCCAVKEEMAIEYWKKALSYSENNDAIKKLCIETLQNPRDQFRIKLRTVTFTREKYFILRGLALKVFINDKEVMTLSNGETRSVELEKGTYNVVVKVSSLKGSSTVDINKDISLLISYNKRGAWFDIVQN